MRVHQIAISVADLDVTQSFYQDVLGAKFVARFEPPGLLFFDFDGVRVLFEASDERQGNSILYLWVDDIEAAITDLRVKEVTFTTGPHPIHKDDDGTFGTPGQTEWMAFFEDPDGNTLALATRKT